MNKIKSKKGFSVAEIVVYVSLFAIVSLFVVNSLISSSVSFAKTRSNRSLMKNGTLIMERISRELNNANNLSVSGNVFNLHPGEISFSVLDENDVFVEKSFYINEDGRLVLSSGDDTLLVSNENIEIVNFVFRQINAPLDTIRVELLIRDKRDRSLKVVSFYNTLIIKGSY